MPRVKKIIQARDGGPIPVAYSEVEVGGETVLAPVVVLEAGAQVQLSGSKQADDTQTENDAVGGVHTFSAAVDTIVIANEDTENRLTAVVNGVTIIVPAATGVFVTPEGTPSATVTVSGSTKYLLNRRS